MRLELKNSPFSTLKSLTSSSFQVSGKCFKNSVLVSIIIVADNLTKEEAVAINKSLPLRAVKYFFSLTEGKLVEVPIPPKMKQLIKS